MVDEFFIFDEVQYTKRDFRNRNRIKTPRGVRWITIPVKVKNKYLQNINQTKVADKSWAESHWDTIKQNYLNAKYFSDYKLIFEDLYSSIDSDNLSKINFRFIKTINSILEIKTNTCQNLQSLYQSYHTQLQIYALCLLENPQESLHLVL